MNWELGIGNWELGIGNWELVLRLTRSLAVLGNRCPEARPRFLSLPYKLDVVEPTALCSQALPGNE